MQYTRVKQAALNYGFHVYQPDKVVKEDFVQVLKQLSPDVIVVVAFGQLLSKEILDLPKYGCINIHASLLPKYRGAAPIQWSIIDREKRTGVTTMYMEQGLDTGDILEQAIVPIDDKDTGGTLHDKLASAGADLIVQTLKHLEQGQVLRTKQNEHLSCYAKMLDKNLGQIDFSMCAQDIERLVRALNPWPSAYTTLNHKNLKIWDAIVITREYPGDYGEIVEITKEMIVVKTKENALGIKSLQLEGKKRMLVSEFLRGYALTTGQNLGS